MTTTHMCWRLPFVTEIEASDEVAMVYTVAGCGRTESEVPAHTLSTFVELSFTFLSVS